MLVSLAATGKKFQKNSLTQRDPRNSAKGTLTILKASLIKFEFIINHYKKVFALIREINLPVFMSSDRFDLLVF